MSSNILDDERSINNEEELDFQPVQSAWSQMGSSRRGGTFGSKGGRRRGFGRSRNNSQEASAGSFPFDLPEIGSASLDTFALDRLDSSALDSIERSGMEPLVPKPRRFERSFSLNLGTTPLSPPLFASSPSDSLPFIEENFHPNMRTNHDSHEDIKGRKKLKQRRNSYEGIQSLHEFDLGIEPDKSAWRKASDSSGGSPRKIRSRTCSSDFPYSPALSSTSSRKRTVEGTPRNLDSIEQFSSHSRSSSTISQKGIFSSQSLGDMPNVPSLDSSPLTKTKSIFEVVNRETRSAVIDTDEDISVFESDLDNSMDQHDERMEDAAPVEPTDAFITRMYRSLRDEQSKQSRHPFGVSSWTVRIPQSWGTQERTNYIRWARTLGFSLFVVGSGSPPMQIPAKKGAEILSELKEKVKAMDKTNGAKTKQNKNQSSSRPKLSRTKSVRGGTMVPLSAPSYHDSSLAMAMERLTVNESATLPRAVTLENTVAASPIQDTVVALMDDSPSYLHPSIRDSIASATTRTGRESVEAKYMPEIMSQECFETPCMSQDQGWGSQMIAGRDWGISHRCDEATIEYLLAVLDGAWNVSERERASIASLGAPGAIPFMPLDCGGAVDFDVEESEIEEAEDLVAEYPVKFLKKSKKSFAKFHRMSIFASESLPSEHLPDHKKLFAMSRPSGSPSKVYSTLHESAPDLFRVDEHRSSSDTVDPLTDEKILVNILSYLDQNDLLVKAFSVSHAWAEAATTAHAQSLMLRFGFSERISVPESDTDLDSDSESSTSEAWYSGEMDRSWKDMLSCFPWGHYLSEGTFKRVYKVHNAQKGCVEALAVMDLEQIFDKKTVGAELSVSVFCGSLVRRGICPNFVMIRSMFTSQYEPPSSRWGSEDMKYPQGKEYSGKQLRLPKKPAEAYPGQYHYIRMELCNSGDAEDFLRRQEDGLVPVDTAQSVLFQAAFGLHAAADKFSMKHYDIKLLNLFLHKLHPIPGQHVLRYGIGSHVFALRMPSQNAYLVKLADFGTANVKSHTNGQPVTIAQFTTLENTPPDFFILGDAAKQGHSHDSFGLGLCMLHLFTGSEPYEELMKDVVCPPLFRKKLKAVWENDRCHHYKIIRNVILSEVHTDAAGNITEGEPDETLYDTFYRFLVLFGIPERFGGRHTKKIWAAIESLKNIRFGGDYRKHCMRFSLEHGTDFHISRARQRLEELDGARDLLFRLCAFNPDQRASALDVLNSYCMNNLLETSGTVYSESDSVRSYLSFATSTGST